jgi:hypothetical protein
MDIIVSTQSVRKTLKITQKGDLLWEKRWG